MSIEIPAAALRMRERMHDRRQELANVSMLGMPDAEVINGNEIRLYGPVDPIFGLDAWSLAPQIRDLDADEIHVRVDSPGGFVTDGVLLYNALADHPANVTVTVDGMAASAASFLAMAGDRIVMNRGSRMLIHAPWGGVVGNASELREMADVLDDLNREMAGIYKARAGGRLDTWINRLNNGDTIYSATQAVELGLADELVAPKSKPAADAAKASMASQTDELPDGVVRGDIAENSPAEEPAADLAADSDIARQRALAMVATALAV